MYKTYHVLIVILLLSLIVNGYRVDYKNKKEKKYCAKCHKYKGKRQLKYCNKCSALENSNSLNIMASEAILDENRDFGESSIILLSNSTKFDYKNIKNLIVFGDSHSSANTNFTDMTYTGDNCSQGKNWPLHLIDLNNMKLWNYAVGGSLINVKLVTKWKWYHIDLIGQYHYFHENMSKGKIFGNSWNKTNSLFALWIGNNDIINLFRNNVAREIDEITDNLFDIINKMYEDGARNFLILLIFQKDCIINKYCSIINDIFSFNDNIIKKSNLLFKKYSDLNIIIYNTNKKFKEIVSNCILYKFEDCFKNWMENKNENIEDYFWINSHISDPGNKVFAEDINKLLNSLSN